MLQNHDPANGLVPSFLRHELRARGTRPGRSRAAPARGIRAYKVWQVAFGRCAMEPDDMECSLGNGDISS